jgi:hypothetical protein
MLAHHDCTVRFAASMLARCRTEKKVEIRETTPLPIRSHFAVFSQTSAFATSPSRRLRLDRCLVSHRCDVLRLVVRQADGPGLAGLCGQALHLLLLARLLGLLLLGEVELDALEEVLTRAGVADVFDADVDALLHVSVADLLVEDDADGRLGDVVDDASLAVVNLVGHTLLDGTCVFYELSARGGWRVCRGVPLATTSTMSPTLYCLR